MKEQKSSGKRYLPSPDIYTPIDKTSITGDFMSEETMAFLSGTKARYIAKPFDTEQLRKDVNSTLAGQR